MKKTGLYRLYGLYGLYVLIAVGIQAIYVAKVEIVQVLIEHQVEATTTLGGGETSSSATATTQPSNTGEEGATDGSNSLISTKNSQPVTTTATTSSTSSTSSSSFSTSITYTGLYSFNESFAVEILELHNIKRLLHGAQSLHWNSTVFDYAYEYAQKYDCSGTLTHSGGSYGENLAIGYTTAGTVEAWYDEGDTYEYGTESTYNHFTAMIWNSTSSLGCAYKYCNSVWGTYIVCSYYVAGNVIGYSSENVFPLISS